MTKEQDRPHGWDIDIYWEVLNEVAEYLPKYKSLERLYHYTGQKGFEGMLKSASIRATDLRFLNDRVEFEYGLALFSERMMSLESKFPIPDQTTEFMERLLDSIPRYVASFSVESDSLSQWGMYAGDSGFCLGFSMEKLGGLALATGTLSMLSPCVYKEDAQIRIVDHGIKRISSAMSDNTLSQSTAAANMANFAGWCGSFFKHPSFGLEAEVRLITFESTNENSDAVSLNWGTREGPHHPIPFVSFPLPTPASVMVGPGDHASSSADVVSRILKKCGLHETEVLTSNLPFRS